MSAQTDLLRLKNFVFWGYHGHLPAEREIGNRFEVDVELQVELAKAIKHDCLEASVDFNTVFTLVQEHLEKRTYKLIETLAGNIVADLMDLPMVQGCRVCVRKLHPPIAGAIGGTIEVEISRVN